MLRHRLARHVQVRAQRAQRLPVVCIQHIQQVPAARIRQRLEYQVHRFGHARYDMQGNACMSRRASAQMFLAPPDRGDQSVALRLPRRYATLRCCWPAELPGNEPITQGKTCDVESGPSGWVLCCLCWAAMKRWKRLRRPAVTRWYLRPTLRAEG